MAIRQVMLKCTITIRYRFQDSFERSERFETFNCAGKACWWVSYIETNFRHTLLWLYILCVFAVKYAVYAGVTKSNIWSWFHEIFRLFLAKMCTPVSRTSLRSKPIDNKLSHWVLPPGHWRLKLKICRLFHANMCEFDAEIKSYKDGKTIWIYHNHYLLGKYTAKIAAMCAIVTIMIA